LVAELLNMASAQRVPKMGIYSGSVDGAPKGFWDMIGGEDS